jgi:AraC-like DNA-binding protein
VKTHAIDASPAPAFGLAERLEPGEGPWHQHTRHQLLYAASGMMTLELEDAAWTLPPQRAAWIEGGTLHRVRLGRPVELRTTYLSPTFCPGLGVDARVFAVDELTRQLLMTAPRWGPERSPDDALANDVLRALAGLAREHAANAAPTRLPRPRDPQLARAVTFALEHLARPVTVAELARAAGMSERGLHRKLTASCGVSPRQLLHAARMLRAMELLDDPTISVSEASVRVGFASLGSFSLAFSAFTGQSPSAWRRRESTPERGGLTDGARSAQTAQARRAHPR